MLKILRNLVILIMLLLAAFFLPDRVRAVPLLPSSFYGLVQLDGNNVPEGTLVRALINGVAYAETKSLVYQGNSAYSLDIPSDDSSTPGKEGGIEGEIITFLVAGSVAGQTGVWHSGVNTELNLSARVNQGLPSATSTSPAVLHTSTPVRNIEPTRIPRNQTAIPAASQQISTPAQPSLAVELSPTGFAQLTATTVQMTVGPSPVNTAIKQIFITPFPTLPPAQSSPVPIPEIEIENRNAGTLYFLAPAFLIILAILVLAFRKRS